MKQTFNPSTCKERVLPPRVWRSHQCRRKIWKDGYCKQHHPDEKKRRDEEREATKPKSPWVLLAEAGDKANKLTKEVKKLKLELYHLARFAIEDVERLHKFFRLGVIDKARPEMGAVYLKQITLYKKIEKKHKPTK